MNFGRRSVLPRSTSTVSNTSTGASTDNESTFGNEVEDEEKDKFKRKTRNLSEKKRRDQFNMLINELCSMVSTNNRKMDKSTVLKSTIAFLKNYQELAMQSQAHEIKEDWKPSFLSNDEFTQLMLEALDSFLLVFTQQGNILYASESITSLLGHLPKDLVNRSLYDFIHDTERTSLHNLLLSYQIIPSNNIHNFESDENQVSFMCHLKRGAAMPAALDVFEYVKVTGNLRKWSNCEDGIRKFSKDYAQNINETSCFCCTVQLQPCQLIREMSNIDETKTEFTSRHSFEWKFLFLDHRAPPIIGYLPFEVLGTSGYDYYHPDDLEKLSACHTQLMQAGEGTSCFYRFLTKGQQWIWLKTRYYITYHQWNSKPEFIVCTHKVISYADVRMHLRKEQGFDEEEIDSAPLENVLPEKSCANSSICQASPTWTLQLASGIPGSSSAGHLRIQTDRADTAEKPHSTLEELTMTKALTHAHIKHKPKTKVKQQQQLPLTVQQQMSLPQLQSQLQPLCQPQLTQIQQQQQQQQQQPPPPPPPPPQASPSTKFQQSQATPTQQSQQQQAQQQQQQSQPQQQQQQAQQQQQQQQVQQQQQQQVQQQQQQQQAQQQQQQQQAQQQQQQQAQQQQQQQQQAQQQQQQQQAQQQQAQQQNQQQVQVQQQQSPQQTQSPASVQPPPPQPPVSQQQAQQTQSQQQQQQQPQQQQQVGHQSLQQLSPSTSQSQLPTPDLTPHPSLTVPGMMMMMAPPTIPTTDLDTVQVSSDLQISTVLNQGQPTLAVSGLSLPQGIAQPSTNLFPQLFMTPAQRQLHKQLQFKSQQLQQTILRQQEELRQITEELALAHQFMPIADAANSAPQMLMMNPTTFTSPTTEIPSTASASQFNILPQQITIQQPVQQQFLPFQILPTSHGQILCQSPSSNASNTHQQQ